MPGAAFRDTVTLYPVSGQECAGRDALVAARILTTPLRLEDPRSFLGSIKTRSRRRTTKEFTVVAVARNTVQFRGESSLAPTLSFRPAATFLGEYYRTTDY